MPVIIPAVLLSPFHMIKSALHRFNIFLLTAMISLTVSNDNLFAQFISVELEIKPELKTAVIQQLEFPDVVINSGRTAIELGEPTMGIFGITAFSTQLLQIQINTPDFLVSRNRNNDEIDRIPIQINAFYTNRGKDDYKVAKPFQMVQRLTVLNQDLIDQKEQALWETLYIYISGSIDVGNIKEGSYFGDIELVVEYE